MGKEPENLLEKTVYLLPTNVCNLKCPECCTQLARENQGKELSLVDYNDIIQTCTSLGYFNYDISGGEPFLTDDLIALLLLIKKDSRNRIFMVSNGTVDKFSEIELEQILSLTDELHISIDSPNKDVHDMLRGRAGAYEDSVTFLKKLNRIRMKSNKKEINCKLGINFIWKDMDEEALIKMYYFTDELELDFLEVLKYINVNGTISTERYYEVFETLEKLIPLQAELHRKININLPSFLYPEYLTWRKKHSKEQLKNIEFRYDALGGCARHLNNIVISATGEITTCVSMLNFKQLTFQHWKDHDQLTEMINRVKEKLQERDAFLAKNEKCGNCERYRFCRGGCPVESIAHGDTLYSLPASCPFHKG